MKPLSAIEVSDILGTIEDAQTTTRATLARWLRTTGYPAASLAAPSSHILDRLTAARKAEDDLFRMVLDHDSAEYRDYDNTKPYRHGGGYNAEYHKQYHQMRRKPRMAAESETGASDDGF
jgi:hypothetical protein